MYLPTLSIQTTSLLHEVVVLGLTMGFVMLYVMSHISAMIQHPNKPILELIRNMNKVKNQQEKYQRKNKCKGYLTWMSRWIMGEQVSKYWAAPHRMGPKWTNMWATTWYVRNILTMPSLAMFSTFGGMSESVVLAHKTSINVSTWGHDLTMSNIMSCRLKGPYVRDSPLEASWGLAGKIF